MSPETLTRLAELERRRLAELTAELARARAHLAAIERALAESDADVRRALETAAREPTRAALWGELAEGARRRRVRLLDQRAAAEAALEQAAARVREVRLHRERWLRLAERLRRRAEARREARAARMLEDLLAARAVTAGHDRPLHGAPADPAGAWRPPAPRPCSASSGPPAAAARHPPAA